MTINAMKQTIQNSLNAGREAIDQLCSSENINFINDIAVALANCFQNGGKLIVAGNGGSLCDAAHFAEELTGVFRMLRPALPAIALSDAGHLTCVGNDLGFDWVFARGVEAYGKPEDIFVGLTTSGNSQNIINAVQKAKELGLKTVLFLGKGGGKLKGHADYELLINGFKTSDRIQEAHMMAIHIIIEVLEEILFPDLICPAHKDSLQKSI
jgi:D-sedoheptulose 7-phosphate isomerase